MNGKQSIRLDWDTKTNVQAVQYDKQMKGWATYVYSMGDGFRW